MATKKPATKKPTTKKPAPRKAKPVGNVSKKTRHFAVWLDKNVVGADESGLIVEVSPGEDADVVCADALDILISNELDTGWREATEDDLKRYG
jgi:hypothetical protein